VSASQYRSQLDRKRKQRIDADKKAGEYRSKESAKRADAAKARQAAAKTSSASTRSSKLRDADRREKEAETAGKEASRWQTRAAGYAKEEAALQIKLARAEQSEADAAERRRKSEQQRADRRTAAERAQLESRIISAEVAVTTALRHLPAPKPEKLRVLMLGASAEGDLRVGREQKRIRSAVESALHRDQIELDVRPAATTADLLDGITKFRPHVVHFSGHSNDDLIVFEDETDEPHEGVIVTARAFARAISATDDPAATRPAELLSLRSPDRRPGGTGGSVCHWDGRQHRRRGRDQLRRTVLRGRRQRTVHQLFPPVRPGCT